MKLRTARSSLISIVHVAAKIASSRSSLPILTGVLMRANGSGIEITATDLVLGYHSGAAAQIDAPGACVVNAKALSDAIDSMPDGEVSVASGDAGRIVVSGGRRKATVPTQPADDFPAIKSAPTKWLDLDAAPFRDMISRVAFAIASPQAQRAQQYKGVVLDVHNGRLRAAATDGNRMAVAYGPACDVQLRWLVPGEFVRAALPTLGNARVGIAFENGSVYTQTQGATLWCKLYEEQPSDWAGMMASLTDVAATLRCGRAELLSAVTTSARISGDSKTLLRLDASEVSIESTAERGNGADVLACIYDGKPLAITINSTYLAEALAAHASDDVMIGVGKTAMDPVTVRATGDDPSAACSITSPMRGD